MEITVEIKNVYGNEMIYPVCAIAEGLAKLAGTKTLTRDAIKTIKELGYKIIIKSPDFSL